MFLFAECPNLEIYCSEPDCMSPFVEQELAAELAWHPALTDAPNTTDALWGFYMFAWCFERYVEDVAGLLGP